MTASSSAGGTTLGARGYMIEPMMMSLQTHVALTYVGADHTQQPSHVHTISEREIGEHSESIGRLRRRLAQMHLAPAPQS
jgi:hypothetical protein